MKWNELFDKTNEPTVKQINDFISTPLGTDLGNYMLDTYNVRPKLTYSNCSMDQGIWKGWNVKYKKSSKVLCTLYPKQGYFLVLLPIGLQRVNEAELLMPECSEYTQILFKQSKIGYSGKSLAFEVTTENILNDLKKLITIRVN